MSYQECRGPSPMEMEHIGFTTRDDTVCFWIKENLSVVSGYFIMDQRKLSLDYIYSMVIERLFHYMAGRLQDPILRNSPSTGSTGWFGTRLFHQLEPIKPTSCFLGQNARMDSSGMAHKAVASSRFCMLKASRFHGQFWCYIWLFLWWSKAERSAGYQSNHRASAKLDNWWNTKQTINQW